MLKCMPEDEHEDMLARELWIQEKFKQWKAEKDAEEQERLVQSGRFDTSPPGTVFSPWRSFLDINGTSGS